MTTEKVTARLVEEAIRELDEAGNAVRACESELQAAESEARAAEAQAYAAGPSAGGSDYGMGAVESRRARAEEESRGAHARLESEIRRAEDLARRCEDVEKRLTDARFIEIDAAERQKTLEVKSEGEKAARAFWTEACKARKWKSDLEAALRRAAQVASSGGYGTTSFSSPYRAASRPPAAYGVPPPYSSPSPGYASAFASGYQSSPGASPQRSAFSSSSPLEERLHHTPYAYASRGQELPRRPRPVWGSPGPGPGAPSPGYTSAASPGHSGPEPFSEFPYAPDVAADHDAPLEERLRAEVGVALRKMGYTHSLGYQGRYGG